MVAPASNPDTGPSHQDRGDRAANGARGLRWLRVATVCAVVVVVTLAASWASGAAPTANLRIAAQVVAYLLLAAAVGVVVFGWERRGWASIGFERHTLGWQLTWALTLLVVLVLAFLALPYAAGVPAGQLFGAAPASAGAFAAIIAFDLLLVGPVEEVVFRGYLLQRLTELLRRGPIAALGTAIAFGLWHLLASGDWLQCVLTAAIGLVLGAARLALPHCTTLSVALAHGLYDVAIVACAIWLG